jgi:hypothetical protein
LTDTTSSCSLPTLRREILPFSTSFRRSATRIRRVLPKGHRL